MPENMTAQAGTVMGGSVLSSVPWTDRRRSSRTFGMRGRNRSNSSEGGTESSPIARTRASWGGMPDPKGGAR